MSALFIIGNLLNMETETIKQRLWTNLRLVLCFISETYIFWAGNRHIMFIDY